MSGVRDRKRIANNLERSRLESKEESKLDTTYEKILDRMDILLSAKGLKFLTEHRDYNSDPNSNKTIRIVRNGEVRNSKVPIKLAEFQITSKVEYNFLNSESPKVEVKMLVYGYENMQLLSAVGADLSRLLNSNVIPILYSFSEQIIIELSSEKRPHE